MNALEKLIFRIGLIDQVSKPVQKIQKHLGNMKDRAMAGFGKMAKGAMGLAAVGATLFLLVSPIRQVNKALGEVRSLGVAEKELKTLNKTALSFTENYGGSASEFIKSSYDIQSAIAGLDNGELAKFTNASAVLAKGTKADVSTITDYMGTMYGIFEKDAKAMGKGAWVEQVAGQTAAAVRMFKTTGTEMSSAFSALGSEAQSAGINMSEQLGIMGTLQATMSGSEAATKYKSFLGGVGGAQDKLGMSFTDTQGRMLPMVNILEKIKGKFGDTLDVAEGDALKKAFGSDEAVALIKNLMNKTGDLHGSIESLSKIKGMENAAKMAEAMVDPYDKLGGSLSALAIRFSAFIGPLLIPFVLWITKGVQWMSSFIEKNEKLMKVIAIMVVSVLAVVAALSSLLMIGGAIQVGMAAWSGVMVAWTAIQAIATGGVWAFTAALLANPIVWIIIGIVALIAAVASLIVYWDELVSWFTQTDVFNGTMYALELIGNYLTGLWEDAKMVWSGLTSLFQNSFIGKAAMLQLDMMKKAFNDLKQLGTSLWKILSRAFASIGGTVGTIVDKVMGLLGLGDDEEKGPKTYHAAPIYKDGLTFNEWFKTQRAGGAQLAPKPKLDVPAGGIRQALTNNSATTNVGGVTINTSNSVDFASIEEAASLA